VHAYVVDSYISRREIVVVIVYENLNMLGG
jgi:hypothetical protein